jgi:23S rRNA (uracil1939-C5)-methyltransferase
MTVRNAAAALDLRVTAMGGLGDGIARLDSGEVVLIGDTLPGDRVQAVLLPRRQGVRRAEVAQLLEPSPQRVVAPCTAFGACGGCVWQHWELTSQRQYKLSQLQRLVSRDGIDAALVSLPAPAGQRRRVRLHLRLHDGQLQAGMLEARSDRVAVTTQCTVLDPRLETLRQRLGPTLQGLVSQGEVFAVAAAEGVMAAISGRPQAQEGFATAAQLGERLGVAGLSLQMGRIYDQWGLPDLCLDEVEGPLAVRVDASGFCQASAVANRAIRDEVAASLDLVGPFDAAQELYAGSGNLTGLLVARGLTVRAVEQDAAACQRLRRAIRQAGLDGAVEVIEADVEHALAPPRGGRDGAEVWLLDPGRMGARLACTAAARWRPKALVYVSCALDKLARDLQILRDGGYRVRRAALIDAFGWTVHSEAVVALSLGA